MCTFELDCTVAGATGATVHHSIVTLLKASTVLYMPMDIADDTYRYRSLKVDKGTSKAET